MLMVTGEQSSSGEIHILGDEHSVGRLGKGVDAHGYIQPETFDRIAGILARYRGIARSLGSTELIGYGTSALRDAKNRDEFIERMRQQTGVQLHVLDGPDEALWTWRGALFGLSLKAANVVVLDIGGGSTEIALGSGNEFRKGVSINTGAVRITERFFKNTLPPTLEDVDAARQSVRKEFADRIEIPSNSIVIGVAGTVTTLGAIAVDVQTSSIDYINGRTLSQAWIEEMTGRLLRMRIEEIEHIPQVVKGREDILPGGTLVLDGFMKSFNVPEIIVSTRGLRYGLLMKDFEAHHRSKENDVN